MNHGTFKVLITGATGLIGREICLKLFSEGAEIVALSRDAKKAKALLGIPCETYDWNPTESTPPLEAYRGVTSVIHLAGESIAEGRWTAEKKRRLTDSRIKSAHHLIEGIKKSGAAISTYVSASAIGYYGDRGEETLFENSEKGNGFLSDLTADWEATLNELPDTTRSVAIRIGLVLARDGGMLHEIVPLFRKGLGGVLGNGSHIMSWIHIDDLVSLFNYSLHSKSLAGPVNAVSPEPVSNQIFTESLLRTLRATSFISVPKKVVQMALGEMGQMLFYSQKVNPTKAIQAGFTFRFPHLTPALEDLLGTGGDHKVVFKNWIAQDPEKVFRFFGNEKNLEVLTPPWLHFKVNGKSTPEIQKGTEIQYRLSLHGVPLHWTSVIDKWVPPILFSDTQKKGPYKKWHHTHEFQAVNRGTLMTDTILYDLPLGTLGEFFGGRYVQTDVNRIFAYRTSKIKEVFDP